MNKWISIAISALSDFIITAGTGYLTIASAGNMTAIPAVAQIVVCVVGGVVQAARGIQKTLTAPPQ
jgi:hypothetical protein